MLKSKEDKMPPCGTLAFIFAIPDVQELNWTWKKRPVKYDLIKRSKRKGRIF